MAEKSEKRVNKKTSFRSYFKKTGKFDLTFFFLVAGLTVVGLIIFRLLRHMPQAIGAVVIILY